MRRETGEVHFLPNAFSVETTSSRYWIEKNFRAGRARVWMFLGVLSIDQLVSYKIYFRFGSIRVQNLPEMFQKTNLILDSEVIA